ncbi:hypothetical protein M885DRAFT_532413 [Pelagophyceae sp. CCMP2097]|nr:hypothetical protein M885DRAFT_532413 [Pelagophyceae sp. CCMP2097]|mmetsp:Transcript_10651/g.36848  ORF Transcript_10651/g.36848 Transcript_10651/m.36848 type:complete len:298 (-) Transcript_10651:903-1796(-)
MRRGLVSPEQTAAFLRRRAQYVGDSPYEFVELYLCERTSTGDAFGQTHRFTAENLAPWPVRCAFGGEVAVEYTYTAPPDAPWLTVRPAAFLGAAGGAVDVCGSFVKSPADSRDTFVFGEPEDVVIDALEVKKFVNERNDSCKLSFHFGTTAYDVIFDVRVVPRFEAADDFSIRLKSAMIEMYSWSDELRRLERYDDPPPGHVSPPDGSSPITRMIQRVQSDLVIPAIPATTLRGAAQNARHVTPDRRAFESPGAAPSSLPGLVDVCAAKDVTIHALQARIARLEANAANASGKRLRQ